MSADRNPLKPEVQRANLVTRSDVAIARLDAITARLAAGNGAWDAATPVQRTQAMRDIVLVLRTIVVELVDSPD